MLIVHHAPSTDPSLILCQFFRSSPPRMADSAPPHATRSPTATVQPTYHEHERSSYRPFDIAELVEIRAHQRTFDNSYKRMTLATLAYGVVVLKAFDKRFYTVGLLYTVLSALCALLAYSRRRHWCRWFSDQAMESCSSSNGTARFWATPFVTAGWLVLCSSIAVIGAEFALLVILLHINNHSNAQG